MADEMKPGYRRAKLILSGAGFTVSLLAIVGVMFIIDRLSGWLTWPAAILLVPFLALLAYSLPRLQEQRALRRLAADRRANAECPCWSRTDNVTAGPVVVLVHGTFARHGPWVQFNRSTMGDSGRLSEAVRDLGIQMVTFCWSGRNEHFERLRAGDELRRLLVELRAASNGGSLHVLAHSHGGNVALYALALRGDRDDQQLVGTSVSTLATPFIAADEVRLRSARILIWLSVAVALSGWSAILVGRWGDLPLTSWLSSIVLAPALLLYAYSIWRRTGSDAERRVCGSLPRVERTAGQLTAEARADCDLLVVGGTGDEAAAALAASQFSTEIAQVVSRLVLWRLLWRFLLALYLMSMVFGFLGGASTLIGGLDPGYLDRIVTELALTAPLVIASIVFLVFVLAQFALGVDGIEGATELVFSAEETPTGTCTSTRVHTRFGSSRVHGLYENHAAIEAVIGQLARKTDSTVRGPTSHSPHQQNQEH